MTDTPTAPQPPRVDEAYIEWLASEPPAPETPVDPAPVEPARFPSQRLPRPWKPLRLRWRNARYLARTSSRSHP